MKKIFKLELAALALLAVVSCKEVKKEASDAASRNRRSNG